MNDYDRRVSITAGVLEQERLAIADIQQILFAGVFPAKLIAPDNYHPDTYRPLHLERYLRFREGRNRNKQFLLTRPFVENVYNKIAKSYMIRFIGDMERENVRQHDDLYGDDYSELVTVEEECLWRYEAQAQKKGVSAENFVADIAREECLATFKRDLGNYLHGIVSVDHDPNFKEDSRDTPEIIGEKNRYWIDLVTPLFEGVSQYKEKNVFLMPTAEIRSSVRLIVKAIAEDAERAIGALEFWSSVERAVVQRNAWLRQVEAGYIKPFEPGRDYNMRLLAIADLR